MKLFIVLLGCMLAAASGAENGQGQTIRLCGRDLAQAMDRVCTYGDTDYLTAKYLQQHQHDMLDVKNVKGHAMKRDSRPSLVEMCCAQPCLVQDFAKYCPS